MVAVRVLQKAAMHGTTRRLPSLQTSADWRRNCARVTGSLPGMQVACLAHARGRPATTRQNVRANRASPHQPSASLPSPWLAAGRYFSNIT